MNIYLDFINMELIHNILLYTFLFFTGFFWKRTMRNISVWVGFVKRMNRNGWSFSRVSDELEKEEAELAQMESQLIKSVIDKALKEKFPNVRILDMNDPSHEDDVRETLSRKEESDGEHDDK